MYSLTFCVRVMSPERHHLKPAVQAAAVMLRTPPWTASHRPASHAHLRYTARNVENASVTRRSLIQQRSHTPRKLGFALCCHSNATCASIANPPNSAQLWGSLYHAPSYIRVRAVLWAYGRGQSHRHTDARDHNTFCVVYDSRKM